MKIIDLLNKIANGEIDERTIIEFDNGYNDYCSVRVFFDRYIMDKENLNLEIKLKEDNNKIEYLNIDAFSSLECRAIGRRVNQIINKINDK